MPFFAQPEIIASAQEGAKISEFGRTPNKPTAEEKYPEESKGPRRAPADDKEGEKAVAKLLASGDHRT
jgi:hypothetical protein